MKIITFLIRSCLTKRFLQSKLILVVLAGLCLTILPRSKAVVPPPDGGYSGFNTAEGQNALFSLTSGAANAAVGWYSLFSNTEGSFNTATGAGTLLFNTGDQNTAFGAAALLLNTTGENNTAVGSTALLNNTTGEHNTAIGSSALLNNTIGYGNTAIGSAALFTNTEGRYNTAIGETALLDNTTGQLNTAVASGALNRNTTGENNTAVGYAALLGNTTGNTNTAVGSFALNSNDTGIGNSAMGANALAIDTDGSFNTAIGYTALSQNAGTLNTAVGWRAGINNTGGSNNIYLGNEGGGPIESSHMRLGRTGDAPTLFTYIAGIFGTSVSGAAVYIDSEGQLGTVNSSRRFKHDIKPMDKASEAIFSLKPVTFQYNSDTKASPQFGLIAEEVAEVNPNLVVRGKNGDLLTVRYEQVNAMLLNEFLKAHRKVKKLEAALEAVTARLTEQETQLQKVTAQIEMNKPSHRVASRD